MLETFSNTNIWNEKGRLKFIFSFCVVPVIQLNDSALGILTLS